MTWAILLSYLMACMALACTPGPNSLLVLSHGARLGWRACLPTIAGGLLGFAAVVTLALLGVASLLQQQPQWLWPLKLLGGAYLLWLGWQQWHSDAAIVANKEAKSQPLARFTQGLLAAVANPKVLLFFAAFLPQFMQPQLGFFEQWAWLTAGFLLAEGLAELLVAISASVLRPWLQQHGRRFNRGCGLLFMLLGLGLPFSG
ncbi:LysE family translocator [Ferrimonas senticii]|uniref:LysE family translocator n=1 Tax=Ferrimonas senticii TaxID=394566 RepID=UPI0003FA0776|nr:LysE family translocator [Ferrimonas senticii]